MENSAGYGYSRTRSTTRFIGAYTLRRDALVPHMFLLLLELEQLINVTELLFKLIIFNRCSISIIEGLDRSSSHSYVMECRLKIDVIDLLLCVTKKVKFTITAPAGLIACVIYQTHAY